MALHILITTSIGMLPVTFRAVSKDSGWIEQIVKSEIVSLLLCQPPETDKPMYANNKTALLRHEQPSLTD